MKKSVLKTSFRTEDNPFLTNEETIHKTEEASDTKSTSESVTIPVLQLQAMLDGIGALTAALAKQNKVDNIDSKLIANAVQNGIENAIPRRKGSLLERKSYNREDLPMEDILDKPALFMAFCMTTTVFDDAVKGHTVNCPHFPIRFNPFLRYQDGNNKTITQSLAVVFSKQQAEFLRQHTYFNIKYFEKLEKSKSYSTEIIDKLLIAFDYVKKLNDYQVKQKCVELNVTVSTNDFNVLRKELAHKIASVEQSTESTFLKQYVEDRTSFESIMSTKKEQSYQ